MSKLYLELNLIKIRGLASDKLLGCKARSGLECLLMHLNLTKITEICSHQVYTYQLCRSMHQLIKAQNYKSILIWTERSGCWIIVQPASLLMSVFKSAHFLKDLGLFTNMAIRQISLRGPWTKSPYVTTRKKKKKITC